MSCFPIANGCKRLELYNGLPDADPSSTARQETDYSGEKGGTDDGPDDGKGLAIDGEAKEHRQVELASDPSTHVGADKAHYAGHQTTSQGVASESLANAPGDRCY